jgi:hypothetical protein
VSPLTKVLVLVGLFVAAWVAPGIAAPAARSGHVTADEPQYLMTAISIGEDISLDISDERAEQRYRVFHRGEAPRQEAVRDDGSAVSPHDPLLPVLLAVPMLVGGWIGAKLALAALAGLLAAMLVWIAVVRFGVPTRVAVVTVLAFSCAAPLAMYGTQVYPELPAAVAVAFGIGALTGPLARRGLVTLVLVVVALPWLSVKYAPVAAALTLCALVALLRRGERARVVALVGGLASAAVVFVVAHVAWYDGLTPYASGSHFVGGELTVVGNEPDYVGRSIRLVGLLLDRDFGLAAWQPAYLLAVPALWVLGARRPPGWWALAVPLAAGWLNATFVALTMHGWWWPGRQLVAVVPCVVLATAWWASTRVAVVRVLAALGIVGASIYAWLIAQSAIGGMRLIVAFESVSYPLVRAWRPLLPDYRDLQAADWAIHGVWLTLAAIAASAALRPRISVISTRLKGATTS